MRTNIKFKSDAFRECVTQTPGDHSRGARLCALAALAGVLALAASPLVALAWAGMVASAEFALACRSAPRHGVAHAALLVLVNAAWAGGALALFLFNPALTGAALIWLIGIGLYQTRGVRQARARRGVVGAVGIEPTTSRV